MCRQEIDSGRNRKEYSVIVLFIEQNMTIFVQWIKQYHL